MTNKMSNKMKTLAVGAAMTCLLGGGATAVLLPGIASGAVAKNGVEDVAGHAKHTGLDPAGHAKHTGLDPAGHAKHTGLDPIGHAQKKQGVVVIRIRPVGRA
jgi:hypothetical protein